MNPLIDVEVLKRSLHTPDWVIADCRHELSDVQYGRRAFDAAHIPGAHFVDVEHDLSGSKLDDEGRFRGRHPLPERAAFAQTLAAIGVTPDTTLVAYDDGDCMYAARLWWLSRWMGHERVVVLDGGLRAWCDAGNALSVDVPARRRGAAIEVGAAKTRTIDASGVLANVSSRAYKVLDARAGERYRGEFEPMDARAGHIPGAVSRPFRDNLAPDGRFKSSSHLRREFSALIDEASPPQVVHYCGSGVSACHNLLAMAVADMDGSVLYPGSWSEWSSDASRPAAVGAQP
jgi:thiosulfate/3-mercaptopyruvate sulfurtransferase